MSAVRFRLVAPALVLLLSACGGDAASDAEQGGSASGEVLPGSISDDMIPIDSLRSQGPQIVERPASAASGSPDSTASEGDAAAGAVEAEPAAEPEAAAE
jgi:hypothetical protein